MTHAVLTSAVAHHAKAKSDDAACIYHRYGKWHTVSWRTLHHQALTLGKRLAAIGLGRGETIALASRGTYGSILVELAVGHAGGRLLLLPEDIAKDRILGLLEEYEVSLAVVEGPNELQTFLGDGGQPLGELSRVIYLRSQSVLGDGTEVTLDQVAGWPVAERIVSLDEVLELPADEDTWGALDGRAPEPDEIGLIAFSAGTSGPHRAVPLAHRTLFGAAQALVDGLELDASASLLVVGPMASAQIRAHVHAVLVSGGCAILGRGLHRLLDDSTQHSPTFIIGLSHAVERLSAQVFLDAESASPLRKLIFGWAMDAGRERTTALQASEDPGRWLDFRVGLANRFVFRNLHSLFGDGLRAVVAVGGALTPESAEFFHAAGILVLESYGTVETWGGVAMNTCSDYRFGTVGPALAGVSLRLDEDDGIEVRAAHLGPEWLATGDLGQLDDDGYLDVIGRREEMIELESGEKVAPSPIEQRLRAEPLVNHALVTGHGRPFVTALLTLNPRSLTQWAKAHGVIGRTRGQSVPTSELSQNPTVYRLVQSLLALHNSELAPTDQVKKFAILERDLTVEAGELTPLLEIRRKAVEETYATVIESMYDDRY